VEKYENLFNSLPKVGGISGVTYKAYIENGMVVKTYVPFYDEKPPRNAFYRKPLPEHLDYYGWVARSGFLGAKAPPGDVFLSALLDGVNMGLLRDAVKDCPLAYLFKRSRKGLWNEKILAYCAKKKGYDTYKALGPRAPSVWHLMHPSSLTRGGVLARVLGPLRQGGELLAAQEIRSTSVALRLYSGVPSFAQVVAAPKAPGHPLRVARQVVIYLPSQKQQILSL